MAPSVVCDLCGTSFTLRANFKRHVLNKHNFAYKKAKSYKGKNCLYINIQFLICIFFSSHYRTKCWRNFGWDSDRYSIFITFITIFNIIFITVIILIIITFIIFIYISREYGSSNRSNIRRRRFRLQRRKFEWWNGWISARSFTFK